MFNETSRCLLLTPFPRLHLLQLPLLLLALLLLVLLYNCLLLELFAKACDWLPNRCHFELSTTLEGQVVAKKGRWRQRQAQTQKERQVEEVGRSGPVQVE
jgi:hypothetical protein